MAPSSVHIPHKEHTVHWLPVRQLKVVWPDAQRGLKDSKMNAFDLFDPDAFGTIYQQYICQDCECSLYEDPDYEAATPEYAKIQVHILPYSVTPVDPATSNG